MRNEICEMGDQNKRVFRAKTAGRELLVGRLSRIKVRGEDVPAGLSRRGHDLELGEVWAVVLTVAQLHKVHPATAR